MTSQRSMVFGLTVFLGFAGLAQPVVAQSGSDQFDCVMNPSETIRVGSAVPGLLQSVDVSRGDRVKRGQIIARLDSEVQLATVRLLETQAASDSTINAERARFNLISKRFKRTRELLDRKVVPRERMDEVETDLAAIRSSLRTAELNKAVANKELIRAKAVLAQRIIRSPIDGIVTEKKSSGGEFMSTSSYVVSLVQLDPLYVEAFLPLELFNRIKLGTEGLVKPAAPIQGTFKTRVTVIDKVFDAASGTFSVRLDLANPDGQLPAGHRCHVQFKLQKTG